MNTRSKVSRILIAVTETGMVRSLWRAAMQHVADSPPDLVAVFVRDRRWQRAASLPFTREVARVGGAAVDFTRQRAEEVDQQDISRARREIEALAKEARLDTAFETLAESELVRLEDLITAGQSLLVVPAILRRRPAYEILNSLKCRVVEVETSENSDDD